MALTGPRTQTTAELTDDSTMPRQPATRGAVSGRALLLGSIGAAATAILVTQAEQVLGNLRIGFLQFPPAAFGLMLVAVMINRGLKRISARAALSSSDLLVIYAMMLVGAMVSSHGLVEKWIPLLVIPKYLANASNSWHALYDPHIAARLVPYNPANAAAQPVVDQYYSKTPRGSAIPWQPWLMPLFTWGILVALVIFAFLCLTAILRRQWVDHEKLAFPLTQLPLEIARDEATFFRNPLMWLGVLLPAVVYTLKAVHQMMPSVPDIPVQWDLATIAVTPPWNAAYCTYFVLSFAALGFFYLLPTDVLFSIWFFFLLSRVEMIVAAAYNLATPAMPLYPLPTFIAYQTIGAYLVLTGYFLWLARPHLAKVWAAAIGREKADDSQEILPYRVAVWGLFGSLLGASLWLWGIGMSLWLALFELGVFLFVTAIVIARATAEAGLLMTETTFRPIDLYRMVGSIHALGPTNLTLLAFLDHLFLRDQRGLLLTGMLDGARISEGTNIRRRSFAGAMMLGLGIALVVAVGLNIYLPYHMGALRMDPVLELQHPSWAFTYYAPYFHPGGTDASDSTMQTLPFFGIGVVVTLALTMLRASFFWWPLHPLGYALSGSWGTVEFWFACLVAWILKSLTLRYGGMQLYTKARPFFLGLIVGEFGIAVLLAVLNILFHLPVPAFPWL